jgi:hypothetical protein
MSHKMLKALILGAVVVSALVSAASASAWTTNGPLGFTATTGSTRLSFTPGPAITCSGANDAIGNLFAKSSVASGARLADVQPRCGGCTVAGLACTVSCVSLTSTAPLPARFNGTSFSGGVTTGTVSNIDCTVAIPTCTVTVTGTVNATYNNATFQFTITGAGQTLSYTATGSTCGALGFAAAGAVDFATCVGSNVVYTVTSSPKPVITNP